MAKKPNEFFQKEITQKEVQGSAHYTYRDGFRLGFGFFIGVLLGVSILIVIIYMINSIIRMVS
ncbi:MAG: hypothetical protein Q8P54_00875 [bacterium]|nr:hypothetical protein [bacterium]